MFLLKKKTIFLSCVFVFSKKDSKKKEGKFLFYFLFLSLGKKERIFVYIGALLQTKTESGHIFLSPLTKLYYNRHRHLAEDAPT